MNLSFGEPTVHQFIQRERDFVRAQAHCAATRDGVPGASHAPFWTRDREAAARARFDAGERHARLDSSVIERAEKYAWEQGWLFHAPHPEAPLYLYARDPYPWTYAGPVFQVWLNLDGTFYSGYHRAGTWMEGVNFGADTIEHFITMCRLGELVREEEKRKRERGDPPHLLSF